MDKGSKDITVVVNHKLGQSFARALLSRTLSMYVTTQKHPFIHIPKDLSQTPKLKTKSQTKMLS